MQRATRLLIALGILAGLSLALLRITNVARAQESNPASEAQKLLAGLLAETGWQYVEEHEGVFRIPMEEGPDVWVHASGNYFCTRAIIGDLPPPDELTTKPLLDLLMANYGIYRGKFGVDDERTVWFEINTPKRLFDGKELHLNILYVARTAAKYRIAPKEPPE